MSGRSAQASTARVIMRLRRRLTSVFALVALVGIAAAATTLMIVEDHAQHTELDDTLRGEASRAAALVYLDAAGAVQTNAVIDDEVSQPPARIVVFARTAGGEVASLLSTGGVDPAGVTALARSALNDTAEAGRTATVRDDGRSLRAVALPWFTAENDIGGAAVALAPGTALIHTVLFVPILGCSIGLLLLLTVAARLLIGRSLQPAIDGIADRERFLAYAAHELRTPLTRLRVGAETLRSSTPSRPDDDTALAELISEADSAGRVISNLLLAARIDNHTVPIRREPVRLDVLAADTERLHPAVVVDVTEPVTTTGDDDLLRHALSNLTQNALRYGNPGRPDPVVVSASRDGAHTVLRVTDGGPGLPADLNFDDRAFAIAAPGGTGLGLSLVAWVASVHGAELHTRTRPDGTGAVVELRFRSEAPPPNGETGTNSSVRATRRDGRCS